MGRPMRVWTYSRVNWRLANLGSLGDVAPIAVENVRAYTHDMSDLGAWDFRVVVFDYGALVEGEGLGRRVVSNAVWLERDYWGERGEP